MDIEIIGWIGAMMLSICGLPQAIKSYKEKHSYGISYGFIFLWTFGEIFQIIYTFVKFQPPIIFNAALNLVIVLVIFYYKVRPKKLDL